MTGNASKAIDALMKVEKENVNLRSELSRTLEWCSRDAGAAKQKLDLAGDKLKEYKRFATKWKKRCDRAAVVHANALKRAKEHAKKEHTVHSLLHKGAYTEETRNLIRLLVHAGCSREYIGHVIYAVFKTAGISVKGNISRCSVGRVLNQGYVAACLQLADEMLAAESQPFFINFT